MAPQSYNYPTMHTFPNEMISLIGSSVLSAILTLWSRASEARQQERLLSMQAAKEQAHIFLEARRHHGGKGFQLTRRLIALVAVFFVIVFPKLVAVWKPEIAMHVGYDQPAGGLFSQTNELRVHWVQLKGLVLTPLDTHLLSAIIGLYFGGICVR